MNKLHINVKYRIGIWYTSNPINFCRNWIDFWKRRTTL